MIYLEQWQREKFSEQWLFLIDMAFKPFWGCMTFFYDERQQYHQNWVVESTNHSPQVWRAFGHKYRHEGIGSWFEFGGAQKRNDVAIESYVFILRGNQI